MNNKVNVSCVMLLIVLVHELFVHELFVNMKKYTRICCSTIIIRIRSESGPTPKHFRHP